MPLGLCLDTRQALITYHRVSGKEVVYGYREGRYVMSKPTTKALYTKSFKRNDLTGIHGLRPATI